MNEVQEVKRDKSQWSGGLRSTKEVKELKNAKLWWGGGGGGGKGVI